MTLDQKWPSASPIVQGVPPKGSMAKADRMVRKGRTQYHPSLQDTVLPRRHGTIGTTPCPTPRTDARWSGLRRRSKLGQREPSPRSIGPHRNLHHREKTGRYSTLHREALQAMTFGDSRDNRRGQNPRCGRQRTVYTPHAPPTPTSHAGFGDREHHSAVSFAIAHEIPPKDQRIRAVERVAQAMTSHLECLSGLEKPEG